MGAQESGKTIFISILSKLIKNKKILIIDFDFINNNLYSLFGIKKYSKEIKEKIKDKEFLSEFKLEEKNLQKLIIKVEKNIDIISNANLIFDEKYILNKEKIEELFKILKNKYDIILIDTSQDTKYKEFNKVLINLSDKIICLILGNLIYLKKSLNLLKEFNNEKKKIEIIYNQKNKYTINRKILEIIFYKYKIIGELNYNIKYNQIINKNVNKLYIDKKIKKEFKEIIKKI